MEAEVKHGATTALLTSCGVALLVGSCDKMAPAPPQPSRPDARVTYDLREKCAKDAAEWFKRQHGDDTGDGVGVITIQNEYTNHYNEKSNRCYAIVLNAKLVSSSKDNSTNVKSAILVDVNENKEIGKYFASPVVAPQCSVDGVSCGSPDGWYALAGPYMQQ